MFWTRFVEFFTGLWTKVFKQSPRESVERLADIVSDELAGFARSVADAGVKDGAGLLLKWKEINANVQTTGDDGKAKKASFSAMAVDAWKQFGGDVQHAALNSAVNFGAELFHQKDKADEVGAPKL
jgi:hypothetical protein